MIDRRDIGVEIEGGDRLRGWLFVPASASKRYRAITMAHDYAGRRSTASSLLPGSLRKRASWCCSTTIGTGVFSSSPADLSY